MSNSPSGNTLRILFVEDNDYLREMTAELLAAPNRDVVSCISAEEALSLFEQDPFDVVLTDVSLPVMSGIELAKRLLKWAPDLWILICSGYSFEAGVDKLGPNVRALPKPFETAQIDAILAQIQR